MCHHNTGYEFAILSNEELSKIQEAEKAINQQNNDNIILLAYKKNNS